MKKSTFLFVLFAFVIGIQAQAQKKMPAFSFLDMSGSTFTNANLPAGSPTIVFFFDPSCEHCAQQAEWIKESQAAFKNTNLVWVSTEEVEPMKKFKKDHFDGTTLTKVYFLKDSKYRFDSYFGYTEAPGIYVYNKDNVLMKEFKKEVQAIELLKALSGK